MSLSTILIILKYTGTGISGAAGIPTEELPTSWPTTKKRPRQVSPRAGSIIPFNI